MQYRLICIRASGIAKGGAGMVGMAGQYLNVVLEKLFLVYNLKVNRVTTTFTAASGTYGPFALPANYLRTYDIFYEIPGIGGSAASSQTLFLNPITMEQFDAEFKSPTQTNYPYEWASDLSREVQVWSDGTLGQGTLVSAGNIFIYPASSGSLTLTHRYMCSQELNSLPNESPLEPWFPDSEYLIVATAALMMGETGDARADAYEAKATRMLQPYLIQEGDEQQAVHQVRLDPRQFRFNQGLRPVKVYPY